MIGAGSGTSLLKSGTGTWILTNANTYAGTTTVQAGSLVAGTNSPGTGTSGAFGNSSAGAIVLGNGSTLAGDAPALLINGALTLNDGSTFAYEMDSSETNKSIAADFQKVFGNLALNGTVKLDLSDLAATPKAFAPNTTLTLINYVGSLSGGFFYGATTSRLNDGDTLIAGLNTWKISYGATAGGLNFATEYDHGVDSKFINLTLTAIPEPGSLLALGCLVGSGAFLRTRRSRSARRPGCC